MCRNASPVRTTVSTALRSAALLAAAAAALPGCSSSEPGRTGSLVVFSDDGQFLPSPSGPGAVPDTDNAYIPDCPPPIGFTPVAEQCAASVTPSGARSVYHLYQRRAAPRAGPAK